MGDFQKKIFLSMKVEHCREKQDKIFIRFQVTEALERHLRICKQA